MITASIFDTREALYSAALRLMSGVIARTGSEPNAIMVPGGRTPAPLFEAMTAHPPVSAEGLHLGYTDERHVPETDPRSNYALSVLMIKALQVPEARVLRVQTALPLSEAAARYHEAWQAFFDGGGTLSLALLGLGEDGHTCSLFTPEQLASYGEDCLAAAVPREPGPERITATPALLARAVHVVFLATGQEKAEVVDAMLQKDSLVTAALAVRRAPRVSLWFAPEG